MAEGIDVYTAYQHVYNWHSVRAAGKQFVYIKLSDGFTTRADNGYAKGAKAAGVAPGGYHYAQFGDAVRQANILVDRCIQSGATDLAPCLDLEHPFTPNTYAVNFAIAFLRQIKRRGFRPCLYANNSMMSYVGPRVKAAVPDTWLWVARYASLYGTQKLRPSTAWDLHQYSQAGHVPGITASSVDLNDGAIPWNTGKGSSAAPSKPKTDIALFYTEDSIMQLPKGGKLKPGGAKKLSYVSVAIPSVLREHDLVIAAGVGGGVHIEGINTWKYITKGTAEKRAGASVSKPGGVGSLARKAWVQEHAALSLIVPKGVGKIDIAYASDVPWSLAISPRSA